MQRVLAIEDASAETLETWRTRLEEAAEAGIDALEVPAGTTPQRISQARKLGLRPLVARWPGGLLEREPGAAGGFDRPAVANLGDALKAAGESGVWVVMVRPTGRAAGQDDALVPGYADALWHTFEALTALAAPAEAAGVTIAVEPAAGGLLLSPVEVCDLLDRVNSPYVAAGLDTELIARIGRPADWIGTLRHRIAGARVHDDAEPALAEIGAALQEVLFTGPVICTCEPAQASRRLSHFPVGGR